MITFAVSGCGKEEKTTTLTGMVVSIEGTVVSLQQFDSEMQQRPSGDKPEQFEGGEGFENFNPENFNREDFNPEDFNPEDFNPEDFNPENFNPEDFNSESFNREDFNPENFDGEMPDIGFQFSEGESKTVDLGDAHITLEIDGGKATGSIQDITEDSFLTITMDGDGKVTNVIVSSGSGFKRGS